MDTAKLLNSLALLLASVGAINWGLAEFAGFNLVSDVFGGIAILSSTIYALVALAGLYTLYMFFQSLSK